MAVGLWMVAVSVLVAYHVKPIGVALFGSPADAYAPATAWILVCILVGGLHNSAVRSPAAPVLVLLTVPVSRRAIALAALTTMFARPSSSIAGVFLAALWLFNIYGFQPLPDALTWLGAAIVLYLSCWLLGATARTRNVPTTAPSLPLALATAVLSSMLAALYTVSHSSRWVVLAALILVSLTFAMALRRIEAALHVDAQLPGTAASNPRPTRSSVGFGRSWQAMLQLQRRVLLRNPRARHMLVTVGVFGLFGIFLSAVGFGTESTMFVAIGQSSLIVGAGLGYTGHSLRVHSTFFDGLMVWPNGLRIVVGSVVLFGALCTAVLFAPVVAAALAVYPQALTWALATGAYAIGVANFGYALASTFETARFDIAANAFSLEGATVARPLLMNACTGLVLIAPLGLLAGSTRLYAGIVGLVGLAGIAYSRLWTERVYRGVMRRRYEMSDGFRTK